MFNKLGRALFFWGLPTVGIAAAVGWVAGGRLSLSILMGGLWNLANLWCLMRVLLAWVEGEQRLVAEQANFWQRLWARPLMWLFVKFPLLYGIVILLFWKTPISHIGFALGFTVSLCVGVWVNFKVVPRPEEVVSAHGH